MNIIGLNAYHPDSAVALYQSGKLVWAAEEERYSRVKHASGFPAVALRQCLLENNLKPQDIQAVGISKDPRVKFWEKIVFTLRYQPSMALLKNRGKALLKASSFKADYAKTLNVALKDIPTCFLNVEHHQAHVASAYFLSGFDQAAFVTMDGMGDFSSTSWGDARDNRLNFHGTVSFPHSAGFLYTAATQFLGNHGFGDEYKVMGLASYGQPVYLDQIRKMYVLKKNGSFRLNLNYFLHHRGASKIRWEGGKPEQDLLFSSKWEDSFGPARKPGSEPTEPDKNIAASVQSALEEIYFHVLNALQKRTLAQNLVLAGGVAFNCVANGKITQMTNFKNVFIQPAAGDAGTAIGAAVCAAIAAGEKICNQTMKHALLGSEFSNDDIETILKQKGVAYEKLSFDEICKKTAQALIDKKVVGWYQGKMEFGPRALGNRSILADPRNPHVRDLLNVKIKRRELYRPFAPAVLEEKARDYFLMDCESSPFMLKVFPVKAAVKQLIPAVTHVDGSARVQTVDKENHPLFWQLIKTFGDLTGVYVILNTSFNEHEPIVCTPGEALDCYLKTQMDVLVLGSYFIER